MCEIFEDMINEAKLEKRCEIAKNLIELGEISHEQIAEVTGLSLEEVQKLAGNGIA
jgi:predicted HTH domain antitoxin